MCQNADQHPRGAMGCSTENGSHKASARQAAYGSCSHCTQARERLLGRHDWLSLAACSDSTLWYTSASFMPFCVHLSPSASSCPSPSAFTILPPLLPRLLLLAPHGRISGFDSRDLDLFG